MSDDKAKRGSPDRNRIDLNDPDEVQNWSKSFGVSPEQLKAAVKSAGTTVASKVREHILKK